jgi:hypothetical protein
MSEAPLARGRIAALTAGCFAAAGAAVALFVLPAEYGIDPTGFGAATGLTRLAGPALGTTSPVAFYTTAFRSHAIDIPLRSPDTGRRGSDIEYKVLMKAGDALVYSWAVSGLTDPEEFYFDFHGEAPAGPGRAEPLVVGYGNGTGASSHGMLVAPIDGVHGWYLQNQSGAPVVVRLRLSGFYEIVPPGEYGNEGGIVARPIP